MHSFEFVALGVQGPMQINSMTFLIILSVVHVVIITCVRPDWGRLIIARLCVSRSLIDIEVISKYLIDWRVS